MIKQTEEFEYAEFFDLLCKSFERNSLSRFASDECAKKLFSTARFLISENAKSNLTAITEMPAIIEKHFADSILCESIFGQGASVADIGCGAGFPTLPLAAARPDLDVCGIDSTAKKINFVNSCAAKSGIKNARGVCARAEELAHTDMRESFDYATARAVAALPVLCEYCLPYVKVGGFFVAMKANISDDETERGIAAAKILGARLKEIKSAELFGEETANRKILVFEKLSPTDEKYPRSNSQIKKKEL